MHQHVCTTTNMNCPRCSAYAASALVAARSRSAATGSCAHWVSFRMCVLTVCGLSCLGWSACSAAKAAQPERVLEVDPLEHGKHQEVSRGCSAGQPLADP